MIKDVAAAVDITINMREEEEKTVEDKNEISS